jgi:hypothetical protein
MGSDRAGHRLSFCRDAFAEENHVRLTVVQMCPSPLPVGVAALRLIPL